MVGTVLISVVQKQYDDEKINNTSLNLKTREFCLPVDNLDHIRKISSFLFVLCPISTCKVGDFGLARWQPDGEMGVETRVIGTFG